MRVHHAVLLPALLLAQGDRQQPSWQSLLQKSEGAIASQLADGRLFDDALALVDESYEIAKGFRDPQLAQQLIAQRAEVVARSQRENKLP